MVPACRKTTAWRALPEMDATKVMPRHTLLVLSTLYEKYELYGKRLYFSLGMWSSVWRNRWSSMDAKVLIASDSCTTEVFVRRSTMQYARAENGTFGSRDSGSIDVTELCYWTLVYAELKQMLRSRQQYGGRYMEVTAEPFRKWAAELEIVGFDRKPQKNFVWPTPASLCAVRYMNSPWYLERDRKRLESWGIRARKPNVQFTGSRQLSGEDFKKPERLRRGHLEISKLGKSSS